MNSPSSESFYQHPLEQKIELFRIHWFENSLNRIVCRPNENQRPFFPEADIQLEKRRSQLQVVLLLSWQFAELRGAALSGGGAPCHSQVPPAQIALATRRVVNYCARRARALFIKEQVEARLRPLGMQLGPGICLCLRALWYIIYRMQINVLAIRAGVRAGLFAPAECCVVSPETS